MVESSGLLNRRTGKTCTGGSNPPLSASFIHYRQLTKLPLRAFGVNVCLSERESVRGIPAQGDIRIVTLSERLAMRPVASREGAFLNLPLLEPPFRGELFAHAQAGRDAFGQGILLVL